eukprot:2622802-Pleurochrysis_carterae.AAC.3
MLRIPGGARQVAQRDARRKVGGAAHHKGGGVPARTGGDAVDASEQLTLEALPYCHRHCKKLIKLFLATVRVVCEAEVWRPLVLQNGLAKLALVHIRDRQRQGLWVTAHTGGKHCPQPRFNVLDVCSALRKLAADINNRCARQDAQLPERRLIHPSCEYALLLSCCEKSHGTQVKRLLPLNVLSCSRRVVHGPGLAL